MITDPLLGMTIEEGHLNTSKDSEEFSDEEDNNNSSRMNTLNSGAQTSTFLQPFDLFKSGTSKIFLLIFLYVLQGVPLGLGASLPFLLQARKVSYKEQALFSLIYWPFSLKLFWAPIVDSTFFHAIGRRKSWLIPTQYLIGTSMYILSHHINHLMGDNHTNGVSIATLTAIFFTINFLAATQDIAVDGWALTMLGRTHSGWVSTCNTVGQTIGYVIGNLVFLSLESEDFSNAYLRSVPSSGGVVSFAGYLYFFSIVFYVSTTFVWLFKREDSEVNLQNYKILHVYSLLYQIFFLPSVFKLITLLLTLKIAFAASDSISGLKLIEAGVSKEKMAMLAIPTIPLNIILPILITKFTYPKKPLELLLFSYPFRLVFLVISMGIVWWAPSTKMVMENGESYFPSYFYAVCVVLIMMQQVTVSCMYVPMMSFFAMVSDPSIGGTYMTLLNTMFNLGGNWPQTLSLWLVDYVTLNGCLNPDKTCSYSSQVLSYFVASQQCDVATSCTYFDGYYVLSLVGLVVGVVWLWLASETTRRLQYLRPREWSITRSSR